LANAKRKADGETGRREGESACRERARTRCTWWDSVLSDPLAAGKPWLPIQQRRLSEIPRELLRVECLRCFRIVEIQKADAVRLYAPQKRQL
jgi:hypothetical protein